MSGYDLPGAAGAAGASGVLPTETADYMPESVYPWNSLGSRGDTVLFEGAIYRIFRPVTIARLAWFVTARGGAPTIRICIFQAANGLSGVAPLVGKIEALAVGGAGAVQVGALAGGPITLPAGELYILQARDSVAGSYSLRAYTGPSAEPLATTVPASTRPARFTTALSGLVTPASFNPLVSTSGGDAIATASDVGAAYRFLNP